MKTYVSREEAPHPERLVSVNFTENLPFTAIGLLQRISTWPDGYPWKNVPDVVEIRENLVLLIMLDYLVDKGDTVHLTKRAYAAMVQFKGVVFKGFIKRVTTNSESWAAFAPPSFHRAP